MRTFTISSEQPPNTLAYGVVKSSLRLATLIVVVWLVWGPQAFAHEVKPAFANISFSADRVEIAVRLALEPILADVDLTGLSDTDASPRSDEYDTWRAASEDQLAEAFKGAWTDVADQFVLKAKERRLDLVLNEVSVVANTDQSQPRDSIIVTSATLPSGTSAVSFGWAKARGPLIVRHDINGENVYAAYLTDGTQSDEISSTRPIPEDRMSTAIRYLVIGFEHIVPKGLDHILFVIGLFLFSYKLRPLLIQVTAFTIAHTVTLALATLDIFTVSPTIVEPLIALSIVYVAAENILWNKLTSWRTAIVFGFGLLHGLGFASVLGDIGLAPTSFLISLISFNLGVELGQLCVVVLAYVALALPFRDKHWYRARIVVPGSAAIALVGVYWVVERVFF